MAKKRITYGLLVLAVILLAGSAIGSTRAAITYYSDNYTAEITVSQIGVSLLENGETVSSRNYNNSEWKIDTNNGSTAGGALLTDMLAENEKLALNRKYDEKLSVKNSGSIDEYVRVRVYRYWMKDGKKVTTLAPDLIDLNFVNSDVWVQGPAASTECVEFFHKGFLPSGEESVPFADTIRIDGKVASEARTEVDEAAGTVTTVYKYDGVEFHVDVEVDAVQTHNAQEAIKSAWGVDAEGLGIL